MAVTTGLLVFNWLTPFHWAPFLLACFMAVTVTVMAHNHNHVRMWSSKFMNSLTDLWLTLFYGFPVFAWIPTHNMNHHRYTNREGDYTITYRISEKNNLGTLLTYPTVSSYYQQTPIRNYLKRLWEKSRSRFWFCISQYGILLAFYAAAIAIDWRSWLLYIFIPHQVGLFFVLVFNYVQHVHADEESKVNHSRNIVGPALNILLFNNGFHTVHHNNPGLHWSELPAAHAAFEHKIDPSLNEQSFWWMIIRVYILGAFSEKFRTKSMRLRRMEEQAGASDVAPMSGAS